MARKKVLADSTPVPAGQAGKWEAVECGEWQDEQGRSHPLFEVRDECCDIIADYLTKPNAMLLVAAPDLLAACETAQCECSVEERESGHLVGCWMPAMQDAIAKAKGVHRG